jgi:hypothetical protein
MASAIQEIASLLFMVHENYLKDVVGDAQVLLALVSLTEDVGLSETGAAFICSSTLPSRRRAALLVTFHAYRAALALASAPFCLRSHTNKVHAFPISSCCTC